MANGLRKANRFERGSGCYTCSCCQQPTTGKHAYINCDTDMLLSDEEARAAIGVY